MNLIIHSIVSSTKSSTLYNLYKQLIYNFRCINYVARKSTHHACSPYKDQTKAEEFISQVNIPVAVK